MIVKALGTTADELLGIKKNSGKKKDMRIWRRFNKIENLDSKEKGKYCCFLDTFIEKKIKGKDQHRLTAALLKTGGTMPCNH